MRFGVRLPTEGPLAEPRALTALARHAEKLGFYAVELPDHIVTPGVVNTVYPYASRNSPAASSSEARAQYAGGGLEQLTTLSYLASATSKIRLMTSVMVIPQRNPILAAKMLATVDVLSRGRLTVGVGIGWMKEEFVALGVADFEHRGLVADEYLQIFERVWTARRVGFEGKSFRFSELTVEPKPVQVPHPPIWVGGESRGAMVRAARYGACWYPIDSNPRKPMHTLGQVVAAARTFRDCCAKEGGRKVAIGLGVMSYRLFDKVSEELFTGGASKAVEDVRDCEREGISYLGFRFRTTVLEETMDAMAAFSRDVIARAR